MDPHWIVDEKGTPEAGNWELSVVVRGSHGILSYGWHGPDKLAIAHSGGPCRTAYAPQVADRLRLVAKDVCEEMNASDDRTEPKPSGYRRADDGTIVAFYD